MIYMILIVALIFFGVGLMVTKDNARYLLAGYNTMKEEDRLKFDLEGYIPYFRKFHVGLAIAVLIIGRILLAYTGERQVVLFMSVFPILAYIYFIIRTRKFYSDPNTKMNNVGIYVLTGALIFVLVLFLFSM